MYAAREFVQPNTGGPNVHYVITDELLAEASEFIRALPTGILSFRTTNRSLPVDVTRFPPTPELRLTGFFHELVVALQSAPLHVTSVTLGHSIPVIRLLRGPDGRYTELLLNDEASRHATGERIGWAQSALDTLGLPIVEDASRVGGRARLLTDIPQIFSPGEAVR